MYFHPSIQYTRFGIRLDSIRGDIKDIIFKQGPESIHIIHMLLVLLEQQTPEGKHNLNALTYIDKGLLR